MTPNVRLHIDRLVLHGFGSVNRARLDAAVSGELIRLFAEAGASASLTRLDHVPTLDAGTIHAAPNASAEKLGVQIAQAIYGGMNR